MIGLRGARGACMPGIEIFLKFVRDPRKTTPFGEKKLLELV